MTLEAATVGRITVDEVDIGGGERVKPDSAELQSMPCLSRYRYRMGNSSAREAGGAVSPTAIFQPHLFAGPSVLRALL